MAWSPSDTVFPHTLPENASILPAAPAASGWLGKLGSMVSGQFQGLNLADASLGLGIGSTIAGAITEGSGALAQANAEKAAADYNARMAQKEGDAEHRRRSRIARQELSSQWVQMAGKSGVIDESGIYRMARNAEEMERDALNAAIAGRNTARLERARGRAAIEIGEQRRTAAIIGGVANVAAQGLSYSIS